MPIQTILHPLIQLSSLQSLSFYWGDVFESRIKFNVQRIDLLIMINIIMAICELKAPSRALSPWSLMDVRLDELVSCKSDLQSRRYKL